MQVMMMLEPTSVDGAVKEPLSAAEAVAAVLTKGHRNASFLNTTGGITTVQEQQSVSFTCNLILREKRGRTCSLYLKS